MVEVYGANMVRWLVDFGNNIEIIETMSCADHGSSTRAGSGLTVLDPNYDMFVQMRSL